jgi:hypothetical protein
MTLQQWNTRQLNVAARYARRYGTDLLWAIHAIAARYARKHER